MGKYKNILNDEISGYHKQVNKMRNNDTNAIMKVRKRRRSF
jgi:hypothetical protein